MGTPSLTKSFALAKPIPVVPPVITATLINAASLFI
jgi:hypothetical protein